METKVLRFRLRDHVHVEGEAPPELLKAIEEAELSIEVVEERGPRGARVTLGTPKANAAWAELQRWSGIEG